MTQLEAAVAEQPPTPLRLVAAGEAELAALEVLEVLEVAVAMEARHRPGVVAPPELWARLVAEVVARR